MPWLIILPLAGYVGYNYSKTRAAQAEPVEAAINLAIVGAALFVSFKLLKRAIK